MNSKACVAMLLAGGEGRRLGVLTRSKAKPAIHFGGSYRIIDFGLSNCRNSGINTVGVVTQYQAASLNDHIGDGTVWTENKEGISLLSPEDGAYAGTADAVYKNQAFIERHHPEHVLILSGDHIYRMDYRKLLERQTQTQSDVTIPVTQVAWEQAHRFGIMRTDDNGRVVEFSEKPQKPKSNLASMGIYIFRRSYLKQVLEADALDPQSSRDFGKDVIPAMLRAGAKLQTYSFEGYWRDVGTVESLWESHMDLIGENPKFSCSEEEWPLYTSKAGSGLFYVHSSPRIRQCLIADNCQILGQVEQSVVAEDVYVGQGSVLRNCVVMAGARIGCNVVVRNAIIGEHAVLEDGAIVETPSQGSIAVVGDAKM